MVVRTTFDATTRGARTSGFRLADVTAQTMPHRETAIPREQMWDNLERFLKAVVPAAEAAGVRLAMPRRRANHPRHDELSAQGLRAAAHRKEAQMRRSTPLAV